MVLRTLMCATTTVQMQMVLLSVLGVVIIENAAACQLRLDIDAAASTLIISGTNSLIPANGGQPLAGQIQDDGTVAKGLSGALYLVASSSTALASTCPTSADGWATVLAQASGGLQLTTDAQFWYNRVALYPPVLQVHHVLLGCAHGGLA
jgi:hypothetical protein